MQGTLPASAGVQRDVGFIPGLGQLMVQLERQFRGSRTQERVQLADARVWGGGAFSMEAPGAQGRA